MIAFAIVVSFYSTTFVYGLADGTVEIILGLFTLIGILFGGWAAWQGKKRESTVRQHEAQITQNKNSNDATNMLIDQLQESLDYYRQENIFLRDELTKVREQYVELGESNHDLRFRVDALERQVLEYQVALQDSQEKELACLEERDKLIAMIINLGGSYED